jgi:hypothetical protein
MRYPASAVTKTYVEAVAPETLVQVTPLSDDLCHWNACPLAVLGQVPVVDVNVWPTVVVPETEGIIVTCGGKKDSKVPLVTVAVSTELPALT